jgi:hypothetical protein
MIRTLVLVAVVGAVTSIVCITGAVMIGGPDAIFRSAWSWTWPGHGRHFGGWRRVQMDAGPTVQRAYPWRDGTQLEVNAPASIEYVQAPGPAKLTISAPSDELDALDVRDGRIGFRDAAAHSGELQVRLQAPAVNRFTLNGAGKLDIRGYRQDRLDLAISGDAAVTAEGEARAVSLNLSGAGEADLGKVKAARAELDISGAGQVTAAPTQSARVRISGLGDVNLLTRPPELETHIDGAGRVRLPDGPDRGGPDRSGGAGPGGADPDAGPERAT